MFINKAHWSSISLYIDNIKVLLQCTILDIVQCLHNLRVLDLSMHLKFLGIQRKSHVAQRKWGIVYVLTTMGTKSDIGKIQVIHWLFIRKIHKTSIFKILHYATQFRQLSLQLNKKKREAIYKIPSPI